jgi:predicted kinase
MSELLSHFLIGPPGCGKSSFALELVKLNPTAVIVSTDAIRGLLFGSECIQGEWSLIETMVVTQIREAHLAGRPVIYDATNAQREWRISLLKQVADENVQWIAWHFQTPLETCKAWNQKRDRIVPEMVIEELFQALQAEPPAPVEGFLAVNVISN